MKRFFSVPEHSTSGDVALLLLRVVAGIAFMMHGWPKIQNPLGWMGPDSFAPAPFLGLAAVAEFFGGLGWVLGLLTPLASLGILCTMTVAFCLHAFVNGDPFVSMTGGPAYELALLFLCISLVLLALGPGRFSLDRGIFGPRPSGTRR